MAIFLTTEIFIQINNNESQTTFVCIEFSPLNKILKINWLIKAGRPLFPIHSTTINSVSEQWTVASQPTFELPHIKTSKQKKLWLAQHLFGSFSKESERERESGACFFCPVRAVVSLNSFCFSCSIPFSIRFIYLARVFFRCYCSVPFNFVHSLQSFSHLVAIVACYGFSCHPLPFFSSCSHSHRFVLLSNSVRLRFIHLLLHFHKLDLNFSFVLSACIYNTFPTDFSPSFFVCLSWCDVSYNSFANVVDCVTAE